MSALRQPFPQSSDVASMKTRWLFVVLLVCLQFALESIAFASPPDPTWLGGFWDDADFDDVILHITGSCSALSPFQPKPDATAFVVFVGLLPDPNQSLTPDPSPFSYDTRAPPAVSLT